MYSLSWLIANSTRCERRKSWPRYRSAVRTPCESMTPSSTLLMVSSPICIVLTGATQCGARSDPTPPASRMRTAPGPFTSMPAFFAALSIRKLRCAPESITASSSLPLTTTLKCGFGLLS